MIFNIPKRYIKGLVDRMSWFPRFLIGQTKVAWEVIHDRMITKTIRFLSDERIIGI